MKRIFIHLLTLVLIYVIVLVIYSFVTWTFHPIQPIIDLPKYDDGVRGGIFCSWLIVFIISMPFLFPHKK